MTAGRGAGDEKVIEAAEKEKKKRKKKGAPDINPDAPLPGIKGGLVVRG
ncbi:MAG: hypothetical protein JW943_13210 [Deltaproteobacteria bacterium]|nr:hypothetical protein [Deltaproteobacteria bacterium]